MAGAAQSQQGPDNSLALLWGMVFVFVVLGLAWVVLHDYIAFGVLWLRRVEASLVALLIPSFQICLHQIDALPAQHATFTDLVRISTAVGSYLRFPISLILIGFALTIYLSRATLRFKQYYSMSSLANVERKNWPQINPVIALDLVNAPIDTGAWAMALTPLQFAQRYHLLSLKELAPTERKATMIISHAYTQARLKKEAAKQVFLVQLGAEWRGVESLSMPAKALFAIFAARGARDNAAADQLLEQIAQSSKQILETAENETGDTLNLQGVEALLDRYHNHPLILSVTHRHAYVLGVMASMLVLARQEGVLASAEFLWLKPRDRSLWFMLNCIGRPTAYPEVAGPFAHWKAEQAVGSRLRAPMIDMAVEALDHALREVHFSSSPQA